MASDKETVEEIVQEMRRDAVAADAWCETHGEMASAASVLNRHADRIEAAHKREIEELREYLSSSSNVMGIVMQWLGRYQKLQEWMNDCVAMNLKALEGAKDEP